MFIYVLIFIVIIIIGLLMVSTSGSGGGSDKLKSRPKQKLRIVKKPIVVKKRVKFRDTNEELMYDKKTLNILGDSKRVSFYASAEA